MAKPKRTPRLEAEQACLVVTDIQGRLAESVSDSDRLLNEADRMIRGARLFDLPIFWLEQLPEKLGSTHERLQPALAGLTPIAKDCFSGWAEPRFRDALSQSKRRQVLLMGIESHICVWQTGRDLLAAGYDVFTIGEAIDSRTSENRRLGLERLADEGALTSSVEMALFDLQGRATGQRFKSLVELVR